MRLRGRILFISGSLGHYRSSMLRVFFSISFLRSRVQSFLGFFFSRLLYLLSRVVFPGSPLHDYRSQGARHRSTHYRANNFRGLLLGKGLIPG